MAIQKKKRGKVRAVIYIRYSSHKQNNSYSVEYQSEECERYINNNGFQLVKAYVDEAKSGKKVAGREAFDAMINDAKRGLFDVIIVFSFSRSFRNTREALNFNFDMREKYNIHIESVIEPIDMTSPHGKFSSTNLFAMHELQSDITAGHVKAGMHIAAQQGYYLGGYVPFGYETYGTGEWSRGKEKRKYRPNAAESEIVKMIYNLYAENFSLNYIQSIMKEKKVYGRKGKIMGTQTLARILKSEFYIGTRIYDIDDYDTLILPNAVPAIIDNDTWARVQMRHKQNKDKTAPRRKSKRLYELTGKIYCEKCGAHYFGTHKNDKRNPDWSASYYTCATKKSIRTCDAKNIRKDKIDRFVIDKIKEHILTPSAIENISEHIAKLAGNNPTDIQRKMKELDKRKTVLLAEEKSLLKKNLAGDISDETFKEMNAENKIEIAEINLELMQLENAAETAITKESVADYLNDILLNIETDDGDILKHIFDKVVDKIIVGENEVAVHLVVSPLSSPSTLDKVSSGQPNVQLSSSIRLKELSKY